MVWLCSLRAADTPAMVPPVPAPVMKASMLQSRHLQLQQSTGCPRPDSLSLESMAEAGGCQQQGPDKQRLDSQRPPASVKAAPDPSRMLLDIGRVDKLVG